MDGWNNSHAAQQLHLHRETVRFWRTRFLTAQADLALLEANLADKAAADPKCKPQAELQAYLETLLSDLPRPGAPATFTPEQIALIVAVACEDPALSDLPLSQWSDHELALEVVRRGIVSQISPRSIGRFLK